MKKHEIAGIIVTKRRHRRQQRECGRRERIFSTVLIYFECQKNTLSEHIVSQAMLFFICFRKHKVTWNPHLAVTRYQVYQTSSKPSSFGLRFFSMYCGFLISLFETMLIYAALGILCWSICKWDVVSVLFNLCIVIKSSAEMSPPHRRCFGIEL